MAYEALYRRYRPSRFDDAFFGQEHIVAALRNAVEGDRVGHAYLFSGPRGTGKTTSARILAKALNCTDLAGGEPCNTCESCQAFNSGTSYDLHELDAASNNGVDAMRDLIGKVALGSPGRTKVYILDEVHMLSSGAENALLKTLEEPPPHVVFVLCTTEPNKVVSTIRSRTQHLEFGLLTQPEVEGLVDHVVAEAGIDITDDDRAYVIRSGGGSARDTLSALDQVVAAGGAPSGGEHIDALFAALVASDPAAALAATEAALQAGRDAPTIATTVLGELRHVFLATMRADLDHLSDAERDLAQTRAASLSPARVTRAVEVLGQSIVDMRQAPDPRVDLEVAFMRLTRPDLDIGVEALLQRIEALEAGGVVAAPVAGDGGPAAQQVPASAPSPAPGDGGPAAKQVPASAPSPAPGDGGPAASQRPAPVDGQADTAPPPAAPTGEPGGPAPGRPVAETAGKRGADLARAELAKMARAEPDDDGPSARPAQPPAPTAPQAPAPTGEPVASHAPPADAPRTLADRQRMARERSGAAEPSSPAPSDPEPTTTPPSAPQVSDPAAGSGSATPPSAPQVSDPAAGSVSAEPSSAPQVSDPAAGSGSAAPPSAPQANDPAADPEPSSTVDQGPAGSAVVPAAPELNAAWHDGLLESLSGRARSRFTAGRFLDHDGTTALFGLPNAVHRDRCEEVRAEVDTALASRFGRQVPLQLVVDDAEVEPDIFASPPADAVPTADDPPVIDTEDEVVDLDGLVDATDVAGSSGVDRLLATFEGSVVLEDPSSQPPDQGR